MWLDSQINVQGQYCGFKYPVLDQMNKTLMFNLSAF